MARLLLILGASGLATANLAGTHYCTYAPNYKCFSSGWPSCCHENRAECPETAEDCEVVRDRSAESVPEPQRWGQGTASYDGDWGQPQQQQQTAGQWGQQQTASQDEWGQERSGAQGWGQETALEDAAVKDERVEPTAEESELEKLDDGHPLLFFTFVIFTISVIGAFVLRGRYSKKAGAAGAVQFVQRPPDGTYDLRADRPQVRDVK